MFEPIAVVGRSCILPGAHSPDALWEAVAAGRDLLSEAPADRWGLPRSLALTDDPKKSRDRAWSARGGYVDGFDFAALAGKDPFRRATEDLLRLDPLFHLVMWAGREALREAGHDGSKPSRASAVFGNLSFPSSTMARYAEQVWFGRQAVDPRNRFMSGLPAHLLAEDQGLSSAFALDAACASSLYALKLACDQLHDGAVDLALAGAVCRADDLFIHVGFCALDAMSRTGRSRPFHRGADGLVPAEGAAFVALMRLDDAVASGRRIFGVIRGVGLSNDGRGKGLLAPDASGQVRALAEAWKDSGVDPARLSLLECHATGTPVGDATEVETLSRFFGGRVQDVPIGSLKSNLGHLITAAGAAGLLKVLGAMHHGVRPPTLHVDDPVDLTASPFRLLAKAEPWTSDGPRVAAVSAFGFGGNNAHVVVEEYLPGAAPTTPRAAPRPAEPLAVVGLAARAAGAPDTRAFAELVFSERSVVRAAGAAVDTVTLPLDRLKFPPRDLQQSLAQQTLLLAAALEAAERCGVTASPRTGVWVGSQSDPEVCRYGARWRLADWFADQGPAAVAALRDAVVPVLESPGVVGNMPNIPANRLSSQLDLGGPGFTVAAEERSGTHALRLAGRALRRGEVDVALVGATDLSAEGVHNAAARAVGLPGTPGDAAVVLVLMREADARAAGRPVLALLSDGDGKADALDLHLDERLGRAHAAQGLVHLAAAVLAVATGRALRASVTVGSHFGGAPDAFVVTPAGAAHPLPEPWMPSRPLTLPGHPPHLVPPGVESLAPAPALPAVPAAGAIPAETPRSGALPPAPALARITAPAPVSPVAPPRPTPAAAPVVPAPAPARAPAPAPIAAAALAPATPGASGVDPAVLMGLADLHRRLGLAHHAYLAEQHRLHAQFLALRVSTTQLLLDRVGTQAAPAFVPAPAPLPAPAPPPPAARPAAAPAPAAPAAKPAPVAPKPAPSAPKTLLPPTVPPTPLEALPGPRWSRADLEVLASDKISKVFGPDFARQDDFPRQVRMPEPPLLLADRVVGLDAVAGAMTTGVIWTETDVRWDSWYLHDGSMPAGVMIEAGQADLLLISWLGADFQNRGERVYRLLGCQLVYHGGLPRAGETLRYEIHVDGHANLGATRIFFFHSDCRDEGGVPRLIVREGQAGFFSEAELAESGGILWSPQTGEHDANAKAAPPVVKSVPSTYTRAQVEAFAEGDAYACFGQGAAPNGYERLQTHVRTPRIAPRPMNFWDHVTELTPGGGPWKKGYLRAEQDVSPSDWFFQGHFKDDPCMPGTMMFEACLQASAFFLTALGYTIRRDGWTFEPVPDVPYDLKCRGQVTPNSKHLVYEVFVEEVLDGPFPTVWADFLCTIDGLKAFHARRVGLRLRPDWPITSRAELQNLQDPVPVAVVDGFPFGYASLMACAWGKPSDAFGPMYTPFDQGRHCARLPGPPYHFMTRLTKIKGAIGKMEIGTAIELEYEVPPDEWYFDENGCRTMPYCVLLEAALQPCGWIACYVGSALTTDKDLYFRNLDGTATWLVEVLPTSGTLTTKAKITNISMSAGMIIQSFEVECFLGDTRVYVMKTVFGFFPGAALANQVGITPTDADRAALHAPSDFLVDLTTRPAKYCGGALRLANPMMLMLDRVSGFWPTGGKKGLGRLRSEKDVDPAEWFFKAHFYTDPVQPGSLGIEAMIQLLQFYMLDQDLAKGMKNPRFEPLMMGRELSWKYRGQVIPENKTIRCEIDITEVGTDERGVYAICDAFLWVDALRIYGATGMGMRIVDDPTVPPNPEPGDDGGEQVLDPATAPWLADHPPTFTLPSLPAMSMVDRLAEAALREVPGQVVEVRGVQVHRWLVLPARTRTVVKEVRGAEVDVALEAWRDAADPALSRFEAVCTGTVVVGATWPAPPVWPAPVATSAEPDPYASGALFHGPAFQYLTALAVGPTGASATLDPARGTVPPGVLGQGLLDALTHAVPHDALHRWSDRVRSDQAAYPFRVERLTFHGPTPTTAVEVEARFQGVDDSGRHPTTTLIARSAAGVWAELVLVEVLVPKGPIGVAPGDVRRSYLRDGVYAPGLALSKVGDVTRPDPAALKASDWLPGTVAAVYGTTDPAVIAAKDHVAAQAHVHPRTVTVHADHAVVAALPLTRFPLVRSGDAVKDAGPAALDLAPVTTFWDRWFGIGRWPVEDLYYGLIRRFLGRVVLEDPAAFDAVKGRSLLFLANHQVGVESLLFSIVVSGLSGTSTVTLAKAEHRETWLGRLIAHNFGYPGVTDPEVITFFDRDDKASLPAIVNRLGAEMAGPGKNVMVHVEGTRSLECRSPVLKMSGAFLDMALAVGAPVVPVRFVGALPVEPLAERLEFPVGMGTQDLVIGRPILPDALRALPLKQRKDVVIGAMNAIGAPPKAQETPFPGDEAFAAKVASRVSRTGVEEPHAVLAEVLREAPDLHPDLRALLRSEGGKSPFGDDPKGQWLAALRSKLLG